MWAQLISSVTFKNTCCESWKCLAYEPRVNRVVKSRGIKTTTKNSTNYLTEGTPTTYIASIEVWTTTQPRIWCFVAQLFDFYAAWLLMAVRTLILLSLAPDCCIFVRLPASQDAEVGWLLPELLGALDAGVGGYPESLSAFSLVPPVWSYGFLSLIFFPCDSLEVFVTYLFQFDGHLFFLCQ